MKLESQVRCVFATKTGVMPDGKLYVCLHDEYCEMALYYGDGKFCRKELLSDRNERGCEE